MKAFRTFKIVLLIATLASCSANKKKDQALGTVVRQDLVQKVSLAGVARAKRRTLVKPGYSGYIAKIHVSLGQNIKEGDPLVRISQTVDQPLSQIFPIRAPFSGIVTQVLLREGEYVESTGSSNAILRLDDISEIWVDANVPEIDIGKITEGLAAQIKPNALSNRSFEGSVKAISLSAKEAEDRWDRGKVEFPVQILVKNADRALKPGMTVMADIVTAKVEKVLTLPHEYIHRGDDEVYVIDSKDERIDIKTGLSNETIVEITEGVAEGTKVKMVDFGALSTKNSSGGRRVRSGH